MMLHFFIVVPFYLQNFCFQFQVFFLTDGHATTGVTEENAIVSNVVNAAKEKTMVLSLGKATYTAINC